MKKFLCAVLAVFMALVMMTPCLADTVESLKLQHITIREDMGIDMIVYSSLAPTSENFSVSIDNTPLTVTSIDGVATANASNDAFVSVPTSTPDKSAESVGTSWLILVDTNTVAINDDRQEPIKATLPALVGLMGPNDNAAIIFPGYSFKGLKMLENQDQILQALNSAKTGSADGSLYTTMSDAIDFLQTSDEVKSRTCLIVISQSKGPAADDPSAGTLQSKLAASQVTLYTVSFKTDDKTAATDFLRLADSSLGGIQIHYNRNNKAKDKSAAEVAQMIADNEACFYSISTAPAKQLISCNALTLVLSKSTHNYTTDYTISYSFTLEEQALLLSNLAPTPTPVPTFPPITPPPTEPPVHVDLESILMIAAIALIVVTVIIIIVVIVRRNSAPAANDQIVPVEIPNIPNISRDVPIDPGTDGPPSVPNAGGYGGTVPDEPPAAGGIRVTLTQIEPMTGVPYTANMTGELVIGRNPAQVQLVINPDDTKISGVHLRLRNSPSGLIAENLGRNGTKVNDVRITAPTPLHQQDVLTMGASRFKIMWDVR